MGKASGFYLLILKYSLGIGILFWLFHTQQLNLEGLHSIDTLTCFLTLILCALQMLLAAWRVKQLLAASHIAVSFVRCFLYNCVGIFYSLVLPGGMSGDAVRAYYFWQCTQTQGCSKKALLSALFIDRFIGTLTMIFMGILAASLVFHQIGLSLKNLVMLWMSFFVGIGVYHLLCRSHQLITINVASPRIQSFFRHLQQLIQQLDLSNYSKQTLLTTLFCSVFIHVLASLIIFLVAVSLHSTLTFIHIMVISPIGLLINAIPISPGGLGVGEKGFELLFSLMGEPQGGTIFMVARVFLFAPAVLGAGFCYSNWIRKYFKGKGTVMTSLG